MLTCTLMNRLQEIRQLNIGDEILQYHIIYSKRKSIEIKLKSDGQIYVSAPFYVSKDDIEGFLIKKSKWIMGKLILLKNQNTEAKEDLINRKTVPLYGLDLILDLKELNIKNSRIQLKSQKLEVEIPVGFNEKDKNLLIGETLKKFYKKYTYDYLLKKVKFYENLIEVRTNNINVRDQKSRWGSCSSKRNINFNLRLAMMPEFVIDYIIIHELCHLKEMNHSANFWALIKSVYPDYEIAKMWLKNNSLRLMFI